MKTVPYIFCHVGPKPTAVEPNYSGVKTASQLLLEMEGHLLPLASIIQKKSKAIQEDKRMLQKEKVEYFRRVFENGDDIPIEKKNYLERVSDLKSIYFFNFF